jgi:alkylation response protein AidB-like acyl-CoA dehydrogenase
MIRLMAQEFARKELEPYAALRDREGTFPLDVVRKMGGLGLLGMMVPPEYGGAGAGAVSYCLAVQEIAYACPSTAVTMSVANLSTEPLLRFGDEAQRQRYLKGLARGESLGCFALTEPEAGSDPGGLKTRAEERGSHYLINGTKVFITHGAYADIVNLIARTGPEKGNRGLAAFVVEAGTPGLHVGAVEEKMGLKASNTVELVFDDCRVPAENIIGRPGLGFTIAMSALDSGRIGIASQAIGIARACLDEAVRYARQRRQFGRAIGSFQAIQWMIADMATALEASRLLTLSAAGKKDQGVPFTTEASMAKLFSSETANRAAYLSLQIHGGYGYTRDFKVERLYRDARATTIYEGTSEIQRLVIARRMLKE